MARPVPVHKKFHLPKLDDHICPPATDSMASTRDKIRATMRKLECPFTWNNSIAVLDDESAKSTIDRLPLCVGPWDTIIQKCHLAYSAYQKGNIPKSSQFIAECFIPLLKAPGLETSCRMTKVYRRGLKHVIDATSAFIRYHDVKEEMSIRDFFKFMTSIPSIDSMDDKQKAAISAIRGKLSKYPGNKIYSEAAIALDPHEVQWHVYLAEVIVRGEPGSDIVNLMEHNKISMVTTWESPEPYLCMADFIITHGQPDPPHLKQALDCIQKALKQFPRSAYVHEQAADLLLKCTPLTEHHVTENYERIQFHYREALRLAGKEILSVRYKLGVYQIVFAGLNADLNADTKKMVLEGSENLKKARDFSDVTRTHYELAKADKLNSSVLWVRSAFMFGIHEYDSYDDDDYATDEEELSLSFQNCTPVKVSKTNKNPKKGKQRRK